MIQVENGGLILKHLRIKLSNKDGSLFSWNLDSPVLIFHTLGSLSWMLAFELSG